MGLSLGQSLVLKQSVRLKQSLTQSLGETIGDIPLYSLHRIKNMLLRDSPELSCELRVSLERAIIRGNQKYQDESGNKRWSCLTSNNLVEAIEEFDGEIADVIERLQAMPDDNPSYKQAIIKAVTEGRVACVGHIKKWFDDRSELLLYDMSGRVPWFVVQRLRRDLSRWIAGAANPFEANINDAILEIATQNGVVADTPEDAWESMGGTIFTKSKVRLS
jgi:hypothetical protein